jgi:hypothetical protein
MSGVFVIGLLAEQYLALVLMFILLLFAKHRSWLF